MGNIMKKTAIVLLLLVFATSLTLFFTACSSDKIATPNNLVVDEENVLTWDEVDNCKGYTIQITNYETGEVTEASSRRATFSLIVLQEGDYDVQVRALPSSRRLSASDWSKKLSFHKDYETGCVYNLINDGREYEVLKVGLASGEFTIEDEYRGKPVTRLADSAFKRSKAVTAITIGNNVSYIGASCFQSCLNLTKVVIPDTVSEIGVACFQSCTSLTEVNIPKNLTMIPGNAFQGCKALTSLDFGNNLIEIGEYAFSGCSKLGEVVIPDSVTTINKNAFEYCTELKKLTIGKNVEIIYSDAFQRCSLSEGIVFAEDGKLSILDSSVFAYSSGLKGVDLPEGLTTIGSNCFASSPEFEHITIPDTVEVVGGYITYKTKMFTEECSQNGTDFVYADKWLVGVPQNLKDTLKYVGGTPTEDEEPGDRIAIKPGTVGIAANTFRFMLETLEVNIPNGVKYIGDYCFRYCAKLWKFNAYGCNTLKVLGMGVFYDCTELLNVSLGQNLEEIGAYAFCKCEKLELPNEDSINRIMPSSVTKVGAYAFIHSSIWKSQIENTVIYVGDWAVGSEADTQTIILREGTKGIADYAFQQKESLTTVKTSDEALWYIGEGAFYMCQALRSFQIGSYVKQINDFTFYGCVNYSDTGAPQRLERIGRSAFYACQSIESLNLSDCQSLTDIGYSAFAYCSSLKSLILPDYITQIKSYTFYECDALESISIPDSVETIGMQAFYSCDNLKTIDFEQSETAKYGLKTIGKDAFFLCYSIEKINIPNTVTKIEDSAFYGCASVGELTLGSAVDYIGDNAFFGLSAITDVAIGNKVTHIGNYAFGNCESLNSIVLSQNTEWIGAFAFYQCTYATIYTDATERLPDWQESLNASLRPVVWGATLSEDGTYVLSLTKTENSVTNANEFNPVSAPSRIGYDFVGWTTVEGGTTAEYSAKDVIDVENGTVLYAVWKEKTATPDTPVTPDEPIVPDVDEPCDSGEEGVNP